MKEKQNTRERKETWGGCKKTGTVCQQGVDVTRQFCLKLVTGGRGFSLLKTGYLLVCFYFTIVFVLNKGKIAHKANVLCCTVCCQTGDKRAKGAWARGIRP